MNKLIIYFRITPRHVLLAVKNDNELNNLLDGVTISQAGVLPHIESILLPKKTANKSQPISQEY